MQDSKLIDLLKSMSKKELLRYEAYASIAITKYPDKSTQLLKILVESHPKFTIDKDMVYVQLYGSTPLEDQPKNKKKKYNKLDQLLRHLHLLAEEHLVIIALQRPKNQRFFFQVLTKELKNRKASKALSSSIKNWQKAINKHRFDTYTHQFQEALYTEQFDLPLRNKITSDEILQGAEDSQDQHLILSKLCYAVDRQTRNRYAAIKIEEITPGIDLLNISLKYATQTTPLIHLYWQLLKMGQTLANEDFQQAFNLLQSYLLKITSAEANRVLRYLLNFCAHMLRTDELEYRPKEFELFIWADKKNILLQEGVMPYTVFLNAIVSATASKNFTLAKDVFIEKYIPYLPSEIRNDCKNLAEAYLFLYAKKPSLAKALAEQISEKKRPIAIRRQSILLRSYYLLYCQNNINAEDFNKRLLSSKRFFTRNGYKIAQSIIDKYLVAISILQEMGHLIPLKPKDRQTGIKELQLRVKEERPVLSAWLQVMLEDLAP